MNKTIFLIATSEVQDDVVVTDAQYATTLIAAQREASYFMRESVGDYLDIPVDDIDGRNCAVEKRVSIETSMFCNLYTEKRIYRCDGLTVSATIQEANLSATHG